MILPRIVSNMPNLIIAEPTTMSEKIVENLVTYVVSINKTVSEFNDNLYIKINVDLIFAPETSISMFYHRTK